MYAGLEIVAYKSNVEAVKKNGDRVDLVALAIARRRENDPVRLFQHIPSEVYGDDFKGLCGQEFWS